MILAGGRGSRFGGVDKASLRLGPHSLLQHVRERIAPQVGALAINHAGSDAVLAETGLPVLADPIAGQPGPLAGILAGLRWAEALQPPPRWLLTAPTDTPFLPFDLVERLSAVAGQLPDTAIIAASDSGVHHVTGLWPLVWADALATWLQSGGRKVTSFAQSNGRQMVAVPFESAVNGGGDPFFNINTPADLTAAERILAGKPSQPFVLGIAGWKNSGKTTLTERLVCELRQRGYSVATIKHAHHGFDVDQPGTDSFRHRAAGAMEVALISERRWALLHELDGAPEPLLETMLAKLAPCDLVLVEGFKRAAIAKLEVRRAASAPGEALHPGDPNVIAIAADGPVTASVPVFRLDAVAGIADLIVSLIGTAILR